MTKRPIHYLYIAIFLSLVPFLWLFTKTDLLGGFWYSLPNIAGLLAGVLMLWQFTLGVRFISRNFTRDYVSILKLHKNLGMYGLLLVFLHPTGEMIKYGANISFVFLPNLTSEFERHVTFGRMSYILFGIIWVTSALLRKRMRYRPWLYIHYLTYPMLVGVFLHAREIGSFLLKYPLLNAYWMAMTFVFFTLLFYRGLKFLNFGKAIYVLTDKKKKKDGVVYYTFSPTSKKIIPSVGQFVFIRPKFFGEVHPFTVMKFDTTSGVLTFGIKAVGPFTNKLEGLEKGDSVFMDGPYGVFTREGHSAEPKVIFAGGIGVTPFVELISRFGGKNTYMFYSNKLLENAIEREEFIKELSANYKDVVTGEKSEGKNIIEGRLDANIIKGNLPARFLDRAKIFVCGSRGFMAGISASLAELGVPKTRIYMEEFEL